MADNIQTALDESLQIGIKALDTQLVALALSKGADKRILAENINGIMLRGLKNEDNGVIEFALSNNADPIAILQNYTTAISDDNIILALEKGLNATQLLFTAVRSSDVQKTSIAVERGAADIHARQNGQPLVFALASIYSSDDENAFMEIFDYLESKGMDINAQETATGNTLLIKTAQTYAASGSGQDQRNRQGLISYLLDKDGIDIAKENSAGVSGLKVLCSLSNMSGGTQRALIEKALSSLPDRSNVLPDSLDVTELDKIKAQRAGSAVKPVQ